MICWSLGSLNKLGLLRLHFLAVIDPLLDLLIDGAVWILSFMRLLRVQDVALLSLKALRSLFGHILEA